MDQHTLPSGPRRLLTIISATSIVTTLLVLLCWLLVESLQKKTSRGPWPTLRKGQLVLSVSAVIISIAHAGLLSRYIPESNRSEPALVAALFEILGWIVLTIALFEKGRDATAGLYWTWACSAAFQIAQTAVMVALRVPSYSTISAADLGVYAARTLVTIGLVSTAALLSKSKIDPSASEEETRPLLDPETSGANDTKADNKADDDDDADDDDEDSDDENETDVADRKKLKSRPFRQYVRSFAIFLPHITPSSLQQWLYVGVITLCILINRVINVLIPLTLGAFINSLPHAAATQQFPWHQLTAYLALNTLVSAGIVSTAKSLATMRFEAGIKRSLNLFCYSHVMSLSCDYHDEKSSSRANQVMERGSSIAHLFQTVFFDLVPQVSDLFISLAVITYIFGGYLCFIVAMTIVLFAYANTRFVKHKTKLRRKWISSLIAQWQHMWETLYSWATISHFNRIAYETGQSKEKTEKMNRLEIVSRDFDAIAQFVRQIIVCTGFISVSYMATRQIVYGSRGIGDFVMLTSYWGQVMAPISGLISIVNGAANDLVDAERVLLLLEKRPSIQNKTDAKDLDFQGGAVEFDHVSFSYDGERVVSEDISFKVKAGQTVAIVGETGGGKSTLLKLLFRFYDPTKGRILVDGQDLKNINIESFRDLVGFVPQDPAMFQRSIADNVRYPDLVATDQEVEAACKGAVLHDKIMTFTKGYKQKVGERGTRLSGGESQRLAVARAILKKPKMLLLDEATSSVDSVTETKIHECLKELCKDRTTFIIAHRLSTILHADLILVMKNGKLVEAGPHRKLIKKDGAYRELWTAQLKLQAQNPEGEEDNAGEHSPILAKDGKALLEASGILSTVSEEDDEDSPSQTSNKDRHDSDPDTSRTQSDTTLGNKEIADAVGNLLDIEPDSQSHPEESSQNEDKSKDSQSGDKDDQQS